MEHSNRWKRAGLVATLLVLLTALTGSRADAGKLDRDLERLRVKARVPGLATAIVVGDEIVQAGGYGWANPEAELAVTPDTLFFLASTSKPIVDNKDWGLGFEVAQDGDHRIALHGGGFSGVTTDMWLDLDERIGVLVLTNGESWAHGESAIDAFFKIRARLIKQARRIARRQED